MRKGTACSLFHGPSVKEVMRDMASLAPKVSVKVGTHCSVQYLHDTCHVVEHHWACGLAMMSCAMCDWKFLKAE